MVNAQQFETKWNHPSPSAKPKNGKAMITAPEEQRMVLVFFSNVLTEQTLLFKENSIFMVVL